MYNRMIVLLQLNGKRVTRPSTMTEYVSWVEAIHSGEMAMHPPALLPVTGNASVNKIMTSMVTVSIILYAMIILVFCTIVGFG